MVWYDDSNHWRMGGGDTSIASAGAVIPEESTSAPAEIRQRRRQRSATGNAARSGPPARRSAEDIGAAVELRDRAADPVVRREVPAVEDSTIGGLELHVGLEQPGDVLRA